MTNTFGSILQQLTYESVRSDSLLWQWTHLEAALFAQVCGPILAASQGQALPGQALGANFSWDAPETQVWG